PLADTALAAPGVRNARSAHSGGRHACARVPDLVWHDPDLTHPGDTLAADLDLSAANLPAGTLLRAGTAVPRVSDVPNDGCAKWKVRFGAVELQSWWNSDGGVISG
ncbi:MAG: hypothetical protein ACK5YF_06665, partial [Rhodobacterales bacterium]